jgi:tRNA(Ile)-lysidine synthase
MADKRSHPQAAAVPNLAQIDFPEKVRLTILEENLLPRGQAVLLGISGGLDSMVLLHVLRQLSENYAWRLIVAHFNHKLRGESSDADEQFVRETARRLGLKLKTGRGDVKSFARRQKISLEMAARQLRRRFFARTAIELGVNRVALAHHADDQVELFFLRLFRGAGPEGLSGMKLISVLPANRKISLVRPFLGVTRSEIEAYAVQEGVRFREDATNAHLDFERNRIRHELLPFARDRFRPALDRSVLRLMDILEAESDFVAQAAQQWLLRKAEPFEQCHPAVQRRVLRAECLRRGFAPDFALIERLRKHPDREFMVSPHAIFWRDEKGAVHSRAVSASDEERASQRILDLTGAEDGIKFEELELVWKNCSVEGEPVIAGGSNQCERFDAEKVGSPVILRHWQAGDRFQPIGMKSAVKVQDLLTNLKVPRERRWQLVVATTIRGEIFWIEGLRIAEQFKLRPSTRRILEWRWQR